MKMTVNNFAQHGPVSLKAELQDDTQVALLRQRLTLQHQQLYEVYVSPMSEMALSQSFLSQAGLDDADELLRLYQVEKSGMPLHATIKEIELLAAFAPGLEIEDAVLDFSLQPTAHGLVISVVFGTHAGMNAMYDHGLRKRAVEEVDDEPST